METGFPDGTEEIVALFERGTLAIREKEQAKRSEERGGSDKRNPSISDANKCERAVVYSLLNVAETNPPTWEDFARMEEGHDFESRTAAILDACGIEYDREVRVEIPLLGSKATGRADFVVKDGGDILPSLAGQKIVLEDKATNGRALGFILKEGKPKEDHVAQLNLYLFALELDFGYIIYGARGSTKGEPYTIAFLVRRDDDLAYRHLAEMERAVRLANSNTIPPRPEGYTKGKYPCTSYCPYLAHCWGDK